MKHQTLMKELAKFAAGAVAADFVVVIWAMQQNIFPIDFLGVMITQDAVIPKLILDAALFILLVHYAWHLGKIPKMREKSYLVLLGFVFAIIAAAHVSRLFFGFTLTIAGWTAPLWLSWLGVVVAIYLAYASFHFAFVASKRK